MSDECLIGPDPFFVLLPIEKCEHGPHALRQVALVFRENAPECQSHIPGKEALHEFNDDRHRSFASFRHRLHGQDPIRPLFGQAHDRNVFEARVMNEPLPQADPHTAQLCEQMCRDLMERRHARTGVSASVRDRLLRTPGHIPDMEEIAADLRITSRTLRRHLTAEGATFRGLLEEVRRTLTEELMANASLTHGEIAERLGYADVTTFIEAFRRWKGMAPSEYRKGQGIRAPTTRLARSLLNGKNTG